MKMNKITKMITKTTLALAVFAAAMTFSQSDVKAGGPMKWGNITTGNEIETYYFTLDQASKVTIINNNNIYMSSGNVNINDVSKKQIACTEYGWADGSRFIVYLEPGEYEAEFGLDLNATAMVEAVPETIKESYTNRNDEINTASKMPLNTVVNGVRGVKDAVDFYSFTLSQASNVNVIFNSPTESDAVTLLNKNGEFIYSCKSGIGTHNDAYVLPAGTYYLEMCDSSYIGQQLGYAYTLQVNAKALKQAQMMTAKSNQSKTTTLTAKKQSGVIKYEFQIAKDKKFKKIVKKVSSKKNTVTVKKLKSGQKLYVRVRCQYAQPIRSDVDPVFPVCSKPVTSYSEWSKMKSVKIK